VLLPDGRPSFEALQKRGRLGNRFEIERASLESPATLYAFDLLAAAGHDLRALPLTERKRLLRLLLPGSGPLRYSDHVEREGEALYAEVSRLGLEGLMAKRADSRYQAGRSPDWLKVKADRTDDFAVVGFTAPKGIREGLGALHVARHDGAAFVYAGKVGSGLTQTQLGPLRAELESVQAHAFPCRGEPPAGRDHVWCEPRKVVEVRYREQTSEGLLRHPVFVRFRDDRRPEDCMTEPGLVEAAPAPTPAEPASKVVRLTNLDKTFWPAQGYTKGDLVGFYREVAPFLLPYLADRPLVLTRFPDGIGGKSFYQKDAPGFAPAWLRTVRVWSEHSQRDIDYFVCEDLESLLWVANSAAIPLHVWSSRVATIQKPDWCILDLDPKGAPFEHVVELALEIRRLTDEIGLPGFVKTSGSTGLHVLLPLGGLCTYEQSRSLGELMAWVIVRRRPEIATIARSVRDRGGRVYIDFLQNVHGQLLVAPFSVRPLPGATVSTPLEWSEVGPGLKMSDFDIRTVPGRLAHRGDPLRAVLTTVPDLLGALGRLHTLLPGAD
jgi:bifunctional non-homologous end joining protein LigD